MKINELVGKEVQIYPGDTYAKYGVIEDWNEQGVMIRITSTQAKNYEVGKSYYFSHGGNLTLKIM